MPRGTPICLKCPSCKRGQWSELPRERGVRATGRVERIVRRSAHAGHGGGGSSFTGHRGEVECLDCGHHWFSTRPGSGRLREKDPACVTATMIQVPGEPKANEPKADE